MFVRHGRVSRLITVGFTLALAASAAVGAAAGADAAQRPGAVSAASAAAVSPNVSSDPAAFAAALKSPDWVRTPNGLMYKSCVHKLPPGASVGADGAVIDADGARQAPPKQCPYPRLVRPGANGASQRTIGDDPLVSGTTAQGPTPTTNGWMIATWWNASTWLRRLYVDYAVPSAPSVAGATNFLFSSFEPGNGGDIIQPVLTYGPSASGGGNYWYITSWYLWNNGNNTYIGPNVTVSPADTIWGAMEGNDCNSDGTHCHWAIITRDLNSGQQSRIDITSYQNFTTAQGGVLESYGATGCAMLPANGHGVFRNIQIFGPSFNQLTPSFFVWQPDPECSMYENYSANSADIVWNP